MAQRILITGGRGFIGSHLLEALPFADSFDLKDQQDIRERLPDKPYTHIFHLAARRSVPFGELYPEQFISTNCWGTVNLVKSYPEARILNVSSSSAKECKSIYGMTKRFTEHLSNKHKNFLSARLYNVFGERQYPESGALVPNVIKSMLRGTSPIIYGDGSISRDFTYVKDVVVTLIELMFEKTSTGLTHVGYSDPISVLDMVKIIYDHRPTIVFYEAPREYDIQFSRAPISIKTVYGRDEGIKRTIRWMKSINGR